MSNKTKVEWQKGRFWPGYRWRILAHKRYNKGITGDDSYPQKHEVAVSSEDYENPIEFDELVIDHWFHLEQMDDRSWWIGLGNWHINVIIDSNGIPHISSYENESEENYIAFVERHRINGFWKPGDPIPEPSPPKPIMPRTKND